MQALDYSTILNSQFRSSLVTPGRRRNIAILSLVHSNDQFYTLLCGAGLHRWHDHELFLSKEGHFVGLAQPDDRIIGDMLWQTLLLWKQSPSLLCVYPTTLKLSAQMYTYITQAMRRLLPLIHWYYFSTLLNLSAFSSTEDHKELCTICTNTLRVCTPQHFTLHWQTQQAIATMVNRAIIKSFFLIGILHYQYCTTWLVQYTLHLQPLKLT